jgi:FkbH-like protein
MSQFSEKLPAFSTWIDVLRYQSMNKGAKLAYTFIDGQSELETLTYSRLDQRARAVAAMLESMMRSGERALLLYPPGLEYIVAFMGCIYAGVIPVPAYPPKSSRTKRHLPRLKSIFTDCQPCVILTVSSHLSSCEQVFPRIGCASPTHLLATDTIPDDCANNWIEPVLKTDSLAFLQYTSGSTAFPKGVMVTHGNLLHNEWLIKTAFEHTEESIVVGWLPFYHDMGLIGNVLQPLYLGTHCVLMSPISFLQDPLQWLSAISRYKATTSGGPNFAYELCVQKVRKEDRINLDLSSWSVAFCGAERVRAETLERFTSAFKASGFRREAFYPCYGLAEATLIVSGGRKSAPPIARSFRSADFEKDKPPKFSAERVCTLIGCGRSLQEQRTLIVDPDSHLKCEPGKIGEIWVSGNSVAKGYWQKPAETQTIFQASTSDGEQGPFLRTGDLGFIFQDELFISGRLKDLIIIGGYNYYPEDIELAVDKAHDALRQGYGAAFSIEIGEEEKLVIVQEVKRKYHHANLSEAIFSVRQAVAEEHGLQPHEVVLVRAGSIPKTSSGKIQRYVCRSQFIEKSLDVLKCEDIDETFPELNGDLLTREAIMTGDSGSPESQLELYLLKQAAKVLRVHPSRLNPKSSLNSLGIDSLMAVQMASQLELNLQVTISMAKVLGATSFRELALFILNQIAESVARDTTSENPMVVRNGLQRINDRPTQPRSETSDTTTIFPITWQQQSLWLQHQTNPANSQGLNILIAIRLKGHLQVRALEQSFNALVRRHAIFRTTYSFVDEKLVQIVESPVAVSLPVDSLVMIPAREAEVSRRAAREAQSLLNLATGPLIRPHLFEMAPEEHVLFILTHHIACDGLSIQLLLKDISKLYQIFSENKEPHQTLPEAPAQYCRLGQRQPAGEMPKNWDAELQYWKQQLGGTLAELMLPRDQAPTKTLGSRRAHEQIVISETMATALKALSKSEEVTIFMVLLSAFKILFCRCSQQTDVVIGSSIANRNSADVQEIIGPFANAVALRTSLEGNPDVREILKRVKQATLGACANQEVPFDAVLREIGFKTGRATPFNAIFLFQNFFVPDWNMSGVAAQLEEFETDLGNSELVLAIYQKAGTLVGTFKFNTDLYARETVRDLITSYLLILEQMVKAPETEISQFRIIESLAEKSAQSACQKVTIAVAATFVSDLVSSSLDFWMEELGIPGRIEFAPYNQLIQQLLDPESLFSTNQNGLNVILVRFADWCHDAEGKTNGDSLASLVEKRMDEFIAALKAAAAKSSVPYIVCTCPSESESFPTCTCLFQELECRLRVESSSIENVHFVAGSEMLALYPVPLIYDRCTDELGHIPYGPAVFTALGTILARKVHALHATAYKVIVLDCDQTLWKGICAENGLEEIEIDCAREALQTFMIAQHDSGMLLCLASKNEETDVLEVFERHPAMRLKLDHITARQINWNLKSDNLKLLSKQLNLGLESFIFIDDSPLECVEVEAACPEVLVLQLPDNPEDIPKFLNHVWSFDKLRITEEDKRRAGFYRQNMQREQLRSEAMTLSDFISSLNLECDISEMKPNQVGRVAQLTQRTNQFNTTAIRRSESEIVTFCHRTNHNCFVAEARDRLGDYGMVGAMFIEEASKVLRVDSFLLSCRALGRGIEHLMLSYLGRRGLERGLEEIHVIMSHTSKNRPAVAFFEGAGGKFIEEPGNRITFEIPVIVAASTKYAPPQEATASVPVRVQTNTSSTHYQLSSNTATRIATQLYSVERIEKAMHDQQQRRRSAVEQNAYAPPNTPIEDALVTIWGAILRLDRVGIHDNFIELGGHSLLGTVLVSRIKKVLGVELPLNVILEKPTIAQLAEIIEQEAIGQMTAQDIDAAVQELEAISDEQAELLLRNEAAHFGLNREDRQ